MELAWSCRIRTSLGGGCESDLRREGSLAAADEDDVAWN